MSTELCHEQMQCMHTGGPSSSYAVEMRVPCVPRLSGAAYHILSNNASTMDYNSQWPHHRKIYYS